MSRGGRTRAREVAALTAVMVAALLACLPAGSAHANGEALRELEGRVTAVDAGAGTLAVTREFRGRTTRATLRAGPGTTVYACGGAKATLDAVRPGMLVSVFYEAVGTGGVVNLLVVEPSR